MLPKRPCPGYVKIGGALDLLFVHVGVEVEVGIALLQNLQAAFQNLLDHSERGLNSKLVFVFVFVFVLAVTTTRRTAAG